MISQEDIDRFAEREEEHPHQYAKRDAAFDEFAQTLTPADFLTSDTGALIQKVFNAGWAARKKAVDYGGV